MDSKSSSERRFALLIDADNVSAKYIKAITDEMSKYGTVTYKRIYGDWTLSLHAKWKDALLENSITPIQQFGYTQGKNATDSAMIIDAMDILYAHSVEGFCIVSSDSDFTRLASRLRESGLMVIGMGEKKTPTAFRKACDIFTTLELLLGDSNSKSSRSKGHCEQNGSSNCQNTGPSKEEIERAVVNIITDNQNNGKSTGLGEVGSRLLKRYPDFDVRSYGTNQLTKLLCEFDSVQIIKEGNSVAIELTEAKETGKETSREAGRETSRETSREAGRETSKETGRETNHSKSSERRTEASTPPAFGAAVSVKSDKHKSAKYRRSHVTHLTAPDDLPTKTSRDDAIDRFVRQLVDDAGDDGVALSEISRLVRAKYRGFKVRDLGYSQFRSYVADLGSVDIEKTGKGFYVKSTK